MPNAPAQPTYKRQRFLLAFMRQLNEAVSATDLQKLVFLCSMTQDEHYYDFIPYAYGPYSFQLAEDVEILCRDHYLEDKNSRISAAGDYQIQFAFIIAPERGRKLLRRAYREYPYYTINSTILGTLFSKDEIAKLRQEKEKLRQDQQVLFTIGYEGQSLEQFINNLIQHDVRVLCDVRKNPLSRKFGFSRNKLEHVSKNAGIQYVSLPELGIESEKRTSLNTIDDYRALFLAYEKTLPQRKQYLDLVYNLLTDKKRVALMCYEKEPEMCHRGVIRDYLVREHNIESQDL